MATSAPPSKSRALNVVFIAIFLALLWTPVVETLFPFDPSPAPNEKRAPAPLPKFQAHPRELRNYFAGLESYYNDHFGFRKTLLRWEHKWKRSWFNESSVSEVMLGKDNWLFLARGGMVDSMLGNIAFTEADLANWRSVFEKRRAWCAQRGIAYQVVIAAEKHSVYPEHLPAWLPQQPPNDPIQQLVSALASNSNVPVLYWRGPLRDAKAEGLLFHRTDSHWNDRGAFIGYRTLLAALAHQRPGLAPLPLEAFDVSDSPQVGGDLAVMLGQEQSLREVNSIEFRLRPPRVKILPHPDPQTTLSGKPDSKPLVVTENPAATGKVVMFHDSFALALQPFLALHFGRVIYVWQHDWDTTFIEQQRPDIIIDEIAERSFYRGDPQKWKGP